MSHYRHSLPHRHQVYDDLQPSKLDAAPIFENFGHVVRQLFLIQIIIQGNLQNLKPRALCRLMKGTFTGIFRTYFALMCYCIHEKQRLVLASEK
jgi:hypothetical protein